MATTPQSGFTLTLPTQDTAGNALTVGQITSVVFAITAGSATADYSVAVPATTAVGATISAKFASLTPPFVPVGNVAYTADVYAVDAAGNGVPSASISWTQVAAVPAAPTGFSVG